MSKSKKQLVKKADITYPDGRKFYVNHKNGNTLDNRVANLELIEIKKNSKDEN